MSENVSLVVGVLTVLTLTCGLVGLGTKFILLPWLREHIAVPVQETQRQITQNKHVSNPPTLLDTIHEVKQDVARTRGDIHAAAVMFEGHIAHSAEDRRQLWEAIHQIRKERP